MPGNKNGPQASRHRSRVNNACVANVRGHAGKLMIGGANHFGPSRVCCLSSKAAPGIHGYLALRKQDRMETP
jgi:hypothetical protein